MIRRLAERRLTKKMARRYMHAVGHRDCGVGFCWRCLWREYTGARERARQAYLRLAEEVFASGKVPAIRVEVTDEMRERVFETHMTHALSLHGQVECPRPHHTLYWPGSRCYCGAQV